MRVTAKTEDKKKENEAAAAPENAEAVSAELIPDEPEYERPKKPWTKDRVLALCLQILLVLMAVSGVIIYKWYKAKNEQYKTGIMEGGELCIAYHCDASTDGAELILRGDALRETVRFSFCEKGGIMKSGKIYSPVSEGSAEIYASYMEKYGKMIYERMDISVDSGMNISYTPNTLTEEEYEEAAGKGGS